MTKIQRASTRYALIFALLSAAYFFFTSDYFLKHIWVPPEIIAWITSFRVAIFMALAISYGFYMVVRMQGYFRTKRQQYYQREINFLYEKGFLRSLIQIYGLEDRISNVPELFESILEILARENQLVFAWIGLYEPGASKDGHFHFYATGKTTQYVNLLQQELIDNPESMKHEPGISSMRKQRTVWLGNVRSYSTKIELWTKTIQNHGVQSALAIPFHIENKIGALCFYSYSREQLSQGFHGLINNIVSLLVAKLYGIKFHQEIMYKALYDPVSQLPNSYYFEEKLNQLITNQQETKKIGVAIIKITECNVKKSHVLNKLDDNIFIAATNKVQSYLRSGDIVARLGSDTLGIVLDYMKDETEFSHYIKQIIQPFAIELSHDESVSIQLFAGLSLYPKNGKKATDLLACAKKALSMAEKNQQDAYSFYSTELFTNVRQRESMSDLLQGALRRNEFELYYQPIVGVVNEQLVGIETFVRWNSPELGQLLPLQFLPVAADLNILSEIEDWVIESAVVQMQQWMTLKGQVDNPFLTINVSLAKLLHPGFVEDMSKIVKQKISVSTPWKLIVEFPEEKIQGNFEAIHPVVDRLKKVGLECFIDDFGIGSAQLRETSELSVKAIKIDALLVRGLGKNKMARALVQGIIAVAKGFKLLAIAEGVETQVQAEILKELGCDLAQGYYYAPPLPVARFNLDQ